MDVLYLLIPLGVVVALVSGAVFWAAASNGQFDDLEAQGKAPLSDDSP